MLSNWAQTICTDTVQHQQSHCMLKEEQVRQQQSSWTQLLPDPELSQQIQWHIYSRKSNNQLLLVYHKVGHRFNLQFLRHEMEDNIWETELYYPPS